MTVDTANGHEHPVRYLHIRRPMIGYAMRGMYVPIASSRGGVTVAYQQISETTYDVAFARCDVKDHYNKELGRVLAEHRLDEGDSISVVVEPNETPRKVFTELAYHLSEHRRNLKPEVVWDGKPNGSA